MVRFHAALGMTWKQGAHPRVSAREAYPRRVEDNTLTKGGIDKRGEACASGHVQWPVSDRRQPQDHVAIALAGPRMAILVFRKLRLKTT